MGSALAGLRVQMENMSPEEQKSLSQLYMFLVQNPKHGAVLAVHWTFWFLRVTLLLFEEVGAAVDVLALANNDCSAFVRDHCPLVGGCAAAVDTVPDAHLAPGRAPER